MVFSRERSLYFVCVFILTIAFSIFAQCAAEPVDRKNHQPSETTDNGSTLKMVHLLFRHGARTPVNTYPNDPNLSNSFYPYGWGQLTNKGKLELYQLGQWLNKRYQSLLGKYYTNELVLAQSSASTRTLMSMQLVLAGMFPPKNTELEWNPNLNWQPIPVYSEPLDKDTKLRMTVPCPRYEECLEEVLELPEVKSDLEQHAELFEELRNITGHRMKTPDDLNSVYHSLWTEEKYGLELPPWSKKFYPEKMEYMAAQHYIYNAYTKEMQKIKAGPFIEEILKNMENKSKGSLQPKERNFFMYCGHDWTITNVLMALGAWKHQIPNFASLAAIELHQNLKTGQHYVEVYFLNDLSKEPQKLIIHGCDFKCPLEDVQKLCKSVIPDKPYEDLCQPKTKE